MQQHGMPPSGAQLTTTEELIVQYLDGELVRKELESVLFERLAQSEDARLLLREHLTLRGALHASSRDDRFQLSAELDARTRARIEQMLRALPATRVVTAPAAAAIATKPATRRLQRWSVRPAYAALLLLFVISGTWFLTRTTNESGTIAMATNPSAQEAPAAIHNNATATVPSIATTDIPSQEASSNSRIAVAPQRTVQHHAVQRSNAEANDLASNSASAATATPNVAPTQPDPHTDAPADVMLTKRFSHMLTDLSKREVVVTRQDRL